MSTTEEPTTRPDAPHADVHVEPPAGSGEAREKYDAFISYSHDRDINLARAVQQGLHRLARPWYGRRALHVFRDATGLGVTPHLWESICEALDSSRFFILMASPESARSEWVGRELSRWLDWRDAEHILIVLSDGTITWRDDRSDFDWDASDALHTVLRGVFGTEPLYLDLRWARSSPDLSLRDPRFASQIAELASPIHGRAPDDLQGEDLRQQQKVRRATRGAVSVLVLLLVVALVTGFIALQQRSAARHATSVALARALGAEVLNQQAAGRSGLALLLAVDSDRANSGLPSHAALLHALEAPSGLVRDVVMRSGTVGNTAFSPDGSVLAAVDGNRIRFLALGSGRELVREVVLRSANVAGPMHYADGGRLLTVGSYSPNLSLAVFRASTGARVGSIAVPDTVDVSGSSTSADAPMFAAVDYFRSTVDIWDVATGRLEHALPTTASVGGDSSLGTGLSRDGSIVATAHIHPVADGARQYVEDVSVWDVGREAPLFGCTAPVGGDFDGIFNMHPNAPQMLSVIADASTRSVQTRATGGTRAIFATCRPGANSLDVETVELQTARTSPVAGISPDGTRIATRDTVTGAVHVYRRGSTYDPGPVEVRASVLEPPFFVDQETSVDFSPDGQFFTLPRSGIGELQVWRTAPGVDPLARIVGFPRGDRVLDVAPQGDMVLMQTPSRAQRVFDRRTNRFTSFRLPAPDPGSSACQVIPSVSFAEGGGAVAFAQLDENCNLRGLALSGLRRGTRRTITIPRPCSWSGTFAFSGDGKVLVAGCGGVVGSASTSTPKIARIDVTGRRPRLLSIDRADVRPDLIIVNADGTSVVSADTSHATGAFQALVLHGSHLARGPVDGANGNYPAAAAFAPDGHTFVTGFTDGRLRLWSSASDRRPVADLTTAGAARVSAVAFSPDGARILSGDGDGSVKLWDVATASLIGEVAHHAQNVDAVTFADDSRAVVASRAHVYDDPGAFPGSVSSVILDVGALRTAACRVVRRDLSTAERRQFGVSGRGHECD